MSVHINFVFFVDNTLLKISLAVMRYAVGAVISLGKLIKFPPTVSLVRCVSAFAVLFWPQFSHFLLLYLLALALCPW